MNRLAATTLLIARALVEDPPRMPQQRAQRVPGHVVGVDLGLACDYSALEYRILSHVVIDDPYYPARAGRAQSSADVVFVGALREMRGEPLTGPLQLIDVQWPWPEAFPGLARRMRGTR